MSPVEAKGGKPQRTDIEYEVIFSELLEGVNQGWSRGNILGFLIAKNIGDAELIAWLHRFAENLQATPEQHQELARRMVLLGEVYDKELGEVAGEIGRRLLAQVPQLDDVTSGEVIEADVTTDDALLVLQGFLQERDIADLLLLLPGNLQLGRGDFQGAITSYDKALAIQPDLHEAWCNRGMALVKLGRFEEAIASYDKALAIQPDFHQAWYNRGNVLGKLERIEEAIASYDKALAIQPDKHNAWINRGEALYNLGRFEEAIASYDKALAIQPDFHLAWYNRGNALYNLGRFEEAIAFFDKALAIQPDYLQAWNNRGLALGNLGRFEEAIAFFDKALAIKPDLHQAWINRGIDAGNSPHYNSQAAVFLQMQFPQSPAVIPNPTLNQRGYEGKLLCYQEGLKHCPQETHPEGWGMLHHRIGNAHYIQGKSSASQSYWKKAVTSYHQALKTLTSDAFPELHLEVLQDLIIALLGLRQIPEAEELKRLATDLLRRLLAEPKSPAKKEQLALKFASFQQLTVDIAIQSGQIIPALETAEAGKNACLSWLLYAYSDEITSPNYAEIEQLLQPSTAIVYWHLSPAALTTFILKNGETPHTLETRFLGETGFLEQRLEKFEKWVKDWNQQYVEYKDKKSETETTSNWRDNLPEKLRQLKEILHIPEIESTLTGITHLILIPHRDLHRFPLHALFADKFTITYLPSAKIGLIPQGKKTEKQGKLLSVEHPDSEGFEDLAYAEIQSTAISQLFQNPQRFSDSDATAEAIKTALASPYSIFHFTGHGTYNFFNPKKSYLALSRKDTLTIEEIVRIPLHPCQLVCLVACETAITGNQSITTEYVGLVSAFLSRGVTYVVSTLWTVESEANALIMMKFYQLLTSPPAPLLAGEGSNTNTPPFPRREGGSGGLGLAEPVALKNAQKWLRQATWGDIQSFYAQTLASLPADADNNLRSLLQDALNRANTMEADHQPFTHPYHWAAFTITGHA
ncbi:tetratricopeptide repeat protein [Aerosakkonema sp. BLCC-F183]|uniref:CHAT domain-containing protein n=1 Tax=Aerosakkonema sp. BLCC-F183 TaxID=3342834 RepID=UPI0035B6D9EE